jgi:hypothetical protein
MLCHELRFRLQEGGLRVVWSLPFVLKVLQRKRMN